MAGIKTTQITVASTAELQAKVAEYTAKGFQVKAISETTASLEKIEGDYSAGRAVLLTMACLIPGIIYIATHNPLRKKGEIVLIQVQAPAQ